MDTSTNHFALAGLTIETILSETLASKLVSRKTISNNFTLVELTGDVFEALDSSNETLYVDDSGDLYEVNIPEQGFYEWPKIYQVALCALVSQGATVYRKARKQV